MLIVYICEICIISKLCPRPLPLKVGVMSPSSYGSAAHASINRTRRSRELFPRWSGRSHSRKWVPEHSEFFSTVALSCAPRDIDTAEVFR